MITSGWMRAARIAGVGLALAASGCGPQHAGSGGGGASASGSGGGAQGGAGSNGGAAAASATGGAGGDGHGGDTSGGSGGSGGGGTTGSSGPAGGGGSGGESSSSAGGDPSSSASASSASSGSGGGSCLAVQKPNQMTTMRDDSNFNRIPLFTGHSEVVATYIDRYTTWMHWNGTDWSDEPIPWPASLAAADRTPIVEAVPLATGESIVMTVNWMMTYDGIKLGNLIPGGPSEDAGITRTSDGRYHVIGPANGGIAETVSDGAGGWQPPAPLPDLGAVSRVAAAALADDRIVVGYTLNGHLWTLNRAPGRNWSSPVDLTPNGAGHASSPIVYAPPGGGVVLAVSTGLSSGGIWRSQDGQTFASGEILALQPQSIGGSCVDNVVIAAQDGITSSSLVARTDGGFITLQTLSFDYINLSRAVALADGRTFYTLAGSDTGVYYATR